MGYYKIEDNLVKFYSKSENSTKELSAFDQFWAKHYPREAWCFRGKIDVERLITALNDTLDAFNFLFCKLRYDENGLYAHYSTSDPKEESYFIPLEIEYLPGSLSNEISLKFFPTLQRDITESENSVSLFSLKISIFTDGFIIGIWFNHVFLDQYSLIHFFKYLSNAYNPLKTNKTIEAPILMDSTLFPKLYTSENLIKFDNLEALCSYAKFTCFNYSDSQEQAIALNNKKDPQLYSNVLFKFNSEKIEDVQKSSQLNLSKNDVISAILLQSHAKSEKDELKTVINLLYACNMRPYLDLPIGSCGNLFMYFSLPPISMKECREYTVSELAELYKTSVEKPDREKYISLVNWFNQFDKLGAKVQNYTLSGLNSSHSSSLFMSNWASLNYRGIAFGDSTLIEVSPFIPPNIVNISNIVYFEFKDNKEHLIMRRKILNKNMTSVIKFGKETGLYKTQIRSDS